MQIARVDGTIVVAGEVGLDQDTEALRRALEVACEQDPEVRVDLSGVTFMDSTGLAMLVGSRRDAIAGQRELVLVAPSPRVLRLLQLTQLTSLFRIDPGSDRPVAVAAGPGPRGGGAGRGGPPAADRAGR